MKTEPSPTKRGFVVTSMTELATVVKDNEATQEAKWRPRKRPDKKTHR
jgi:hypothetical protein